MSQGPIMSCNTLGIVTILQSQSAFYLFCDQRSPGYFGELCTNFVGFFTQKIYVSLLAFYNCKGKSVTKKIALPNNMPDKNVATF
jgi:hypothetical protein